MIPLMNIKDTENYQNLHLSDAQYVLAFRNLIEFYGKMMLGYKNCYSTSLYYVTPKIKKSEYPSFIDFLMNKIAYSNWPNKWKDNNPHYKNFKKWLYNFEKALKEFKKTHLDFYLEYLIIELKIAITFGYDQYIYLPNIPNIYIDYMVSLKRYNVMDHSKISYDKFANTGRLFSSYDFIFEFERSARSIELMMKKNRFCFSKLFYSIGYRFPKMVRKQTFPWKYFMKNHYIETLHSKTDLLFKKHSIKYNDCYSNLNLLIEA